MSANTLSWIIIAVLGILILMVLFFFGDRFLKRTNISLNIGQFDFPTPLKRSWVVFIAILLGISWLPIAVFTETPLVMEWFKSISSDTLSPWELRSIPRLLLGLPFCLFVIPLILRIKPENYREFLQASGFISFKRDGSLLTCTMVVSTLLLSVLSQNSFTNLIDILNPFTNTWTWLADIQAPLFEELLFRGIILGVLLKYLNFWQAAGLASLLFGVIHIFTGGLFIFIQSTLFALFLYSILRVLTGSIWSGVFVHFVGNAAGIPLFIAYLITLSVAFALLYRRGQKIKSQAQHPLSP